MGRTFAVGFIITKTVSPLEVLLYMVGAHRSIMGSCYNFMVTSTEDLTATCAAALDYPNLQ